MQSAREIALRTLAGDCDPLVACRSLSKFQDRLPGVAARVMDVFVGVASEIDDLPLGPERANWATVPLAAKDLEAAEYRERVRGVVSDALRELLDNTEGL